jgi:hypothetical protein
MSKLFSAQGAPAFRGVSLEPFTGIISVQEASWKKTKSNEIMMKVTPVNGRTLYLGFNMEFKDIDLDDVKSLQIKDSLIESINPKA